MADISKITLNADNYNIKDSDAQVRLGGLYFVKCTKAEYDVLSERDQNTVYLITSSGSPILNVSPSAITAVSGGSEENITIASSQDWSIASSEDWITFSQDSGESGTYTVTATISGNSSSARTAVITVDNGDLYESIDVQQDGIPDYSQMPLTIEVISGGTLSFKTSNSNLTKTIEYSLDDGSTWSSMTITSTPTELSVSAGDKVQLRGDNSAYGDGTQNTTLSGSTAVYNLYGNIMSLITSTGYTTATTLATSYTFYSLFFSCTGLTSAENLVLPATTLTQGCYNGMFWDCTSLTTTPELPATTLTGNYSYQNMFRGCTSLITAPSILPATTLTQGCYNGMFRGCTSLTTAPELPATTLANSCYREMFRGCTRLNYIKCLATDISATQCIYNWVSGVSSTGTFVKADTMTGWTTGNNGIPTNWTVLNNSLAEPLTFNITSDGDIHFNGFGQIVEYNLNGGGWTEFTRGDPGPGGDDAFITVQSGDVVKFRQGSDPTANPDNMFQGSTCGFSVSGNLMSLFDQTGYTSGATYIEDGACASLFSECTGLTDASNLTLPGTEIGEYAYDGMFAGCTSLVNAPAVLPATTIRGGAYGNMFGYCTSLTGAPIICATTMTGDNNMNNMFTNCTSLTTAPALPATALTSSCYEYMFAGCTSLTTAPVLPVTTLADNCYYSMFQYCTSLTTAPALPATALTSSCYEGMFCGCTGLTAAPDLPAPLMVQSCYAWMFLDCENLAYLKCLATGDTSGQGEDNFTGYWLDNVAASGTFVKAAGMNDWEIDSSSGIPEGWTVQDYQP